MADSKHNVSWVMSFEVAGAVEGAKKATQATQVLADSLEVVGGKVEKVTGNFSALLDPEGKVREDMKKLTLTLTGINTELKKADLVTQQLANSFGQELTAVNTVNFAVQNFSKGFASSLMEQERRMRASLAVQAATGNASVVKSLEIAEERRRVEATFYKAAEKLQQQYKEGVLKNSDMFREQRALIANLRAELEKLQNKTITIKVNQEILNKDISGQQSRYSNALKANLAVQGGTDPRIAAANEQAANSAYTAQVKLNTALEDAKNKGLNWIQTLALTRRAYQEYNTAIETSNATLLRRIRIVNQEAEAQERTVATFDRVLAEREARLHSSMERQHATAVHGEDSIQVERIRAAELERRLFTRQQAELESIRTSVVDRLISSSEGLHRASIINERYANTLGLINRRLYEQEQVAASVTDRHRNLVTRVLELISIYTIWNNTIGLVRQSLTNIPKAGLEQQATQASLLGIFGTEKGNENIKFLADIADKAGQSILVLEQAYRRYAPSAILAGAKQEAVNKSFRDFAEVGTILHLPEEKINSLFLALDQMYSKGVVQSEEIKKQLGNVLPGAVEIGAQAMKKTPAEFMTAMKKNEVTAKEFVPKFAELYRKFFGGVDDSVFLTVATQLQSNLERVKNEYIYTNRAIFQDTKTVLNDIVKSTANAITSIRENLTAIGQVIEIVSSLIITRLAIAAFGALIVNADIVILRLTAITRLLTGLSMPALTAAAATVYLYGKLNDLSLGYEKATGFVVKYKEQQVSLTSYLESFAILTLDKLEKSYKRVRDITNSLLNLNLQSGEGWKIALAPLDALIDTLKRAGAALGAMSDMAEAGKQGRLLTFAEAFKKNMEEDTTTVFADALARDTADFIESFNGKSALEVSKAIAAGKLKTTEEITKALAHTEDIPAMPLASGIEDNGIKDLSKSAKAIRNIYKDLERDLAAYDDTFKVFMQGIENRYKDNELSTKDYYATIIAERHKDMQDKLNVVAQMNNIAIKNKDIPKQEEFDDKAVAIEKEYRAFKLDMLGKEKDAQKQITKLIEDTEVAYLRLNSVRKADAVEIARQAQEHKAILEREAKDNPAAKLALEHFNQVIAVKQATVDVENATKNVTIAEQQLQVTLLMTNSLREAGVYTAEQAANKILEAQKKLNNEENIALETLKKKLAINKDDLDTLNKIAALKAKKEETINTGIAGANAIANSGSSQFDFAKTYVSEQQQLSEKNRQYLIDQATGTEEEIAAKRKAINDSFNRGHFVSTTKLYAGLAGVGADTFMGLTTLAIKMYGAQSTQAKMAFTLYKAMAIAQAGMQIAQNVLIAFGSGAAVPFVGPVTTAPAYAAIAAGLGVIQLATIIAAPMPQAHAGLDYVPEDNQTYLLSKGEMVLAPPQGKAITQLSKDVAIAMRDRQVPTVSKGTSDKAINNPSIQVKPAIKIVNVGYKEEFRDYLTSNEGEEIIINHMRRNGATV